MNLSPSNHLVLAHYEGRWGKPANIHTFDKPQVPAPVRPLYIAEFSLPADGLTIYASIGMSRAPMSLRTSSPSHRVEAYLGTFDSSPALPEVMAMVAAYPHLAHTFIGVEHTIPIGDPIIPGSGMTAVLLSLPYFEPPKFGQINLREYHVQVLWVIPLYESE